VAVAQFVVTEAVECQNILWVDVEDVLKNSMGLRAQAKHQKNLGFETQPQALAAYGGLFVIPCGT
jgi:hypothetical protein